MIRTGGRLPLSLLLISVVGFSLLVGFEQGGTSACERTSQLQLQFAWSAHRVEAILDCWGDAGRAQVLKGIAADFLFLAGYAPLLAVLVLRLRSRLARLGASRWSRPGRWLVSGQLFAGMLDAVENVLLWMVIRGVADGAFAVVIGSIAAIKFLFVGAGLTYLITGASRCIWMRCRGRG